MAKKILQSFGLTFLISAILAWPLTFLGVSFISGVLFFSAVQFVGFYFYREIQERKLLLEQQNFILAREAELSKQGSEVICPCDRQVKCFVPIKLNERNEYVCPGCNKDANVNVLLKTVLVTTPIIESAEDVIANNLKEKNGSN
jgi:hypothetical protein